MNLAGVFAPVPTPFDDRDRVDTARLRTMLAKMASRPLDGVVVLGSNGEAVLMDDFESDQAIVAAREAVPSTKRFIVGTGRESTQAAVKATKRAAEHGADAVLVRTPGFFKPQMTTDAFVRHYTAVADASPVPVLLYNFMKESGGDIAQIADLVAGTPDDFIVLAGTALNFYPALCVGATGGILALACVLPDACAQVFTLFKAKRHDEARALQRQIVPMARLLGQSYGVPGLKAALNIAGYDTGFPRPPLSPAPESAIDALRDALKPFEEIPA